MPVDIITPVAHIKPPVAHIKPPVADTKTPVAHINPPVGSVQKQPVDMKTVAKIKFVISAHFNRFILICDSRFLTRYLVYKHGVVREPFLPSFWEI